MLRRSSRQRPRGNPKSASSCNQASILTGRSLHIREWLFLRRPRPWGFVMWARSRRGSRRCEWENRRLGMHSSLSPWISTLSLHVAILADDAVGDSWFSSHSADGFGLCGQDGARHHNHHLSTVCRIGTTLHTLRQRQTARPGRAGWRFELPATLDGRLGCHVPSFLDARFRGVD